MSEENLEKHVNTEVLKGLSAFLAREGVANDYLDVDPDTTGWSDFYDLCRGTGINSQEGRTVFGGIVRLFMNSVPAYVDVTCLNTGLMTTNMKICSLGEPTPEKKVLKWFNETEQRLREAHYGL